MKDLNGFYTREFFITNDYDQIINTQFKQISFDNPIEVKKLFIEILSIEDIYILLYLLQKVTPACEFIDNTILELFYKVQSLYKNAIFPFINLDEFMNNCIINKLSSNITIEVFISSMCNYKFNEENIVYIRKYFGFSQIYKYFKVVVEKVFAVQISCQEISFMLILLDNYDLVLSLFTPILKRTSLYVSNNIIDINIVQCVEVIKAVCLFDASLFNGFPDYILSITSFIIQIFYNPEHLEFLSLSDSDLILDGIRIFLNASKENPKIKNISAGIYKKVYEKLKEFIDRNTTVFEEYILIVCLIDIIYIYYTFSYEQGSRMFNFDEMFIIIKGITLVFPDAVDKVSKKAVMARFFERKYKILDAIIPYLENKEDISSILRNDLSYKGVSIYILRNLKNIIEYVDWEDCISFACIEENTESFINFIFDERFTESKDHDHCENISLYVASLSSINNQDLLLFATKLFTERYKDKCLTQKQIHTMFELYLFNIETINDCRVKKRRELILNFVHYYIDKSMSDILLSEFISKVFKINYLFPNVNILLLIFILAKNNKNISEELINTVTKYILDTIDRQYEEHSHLKHCINMYLAVIVEILRFHNKEIFFTDNDLVVNQKTYFKLLIGLMCCMNKNVKDDYLNIVKKYLLNYLFYANEDEKENLHIILGYCDKKYANNNQNSSDLIDMCRFIKIRFDVL